MESKFKAKGMVLGNLWGGGKGAYPTIEVAADSREEVHSLIKIHLNSGSLDSGMGFESLVGAVMIVTKITRIEVDGLPFSNRQEEVELFGDLNEFEQEFLLDNLR